MSDIGVTVVDIKTGKPKLLDNVGGPVYDRLANMIDDLIAGKTPVYPKLDPKKWDASTFSTFA